MHGRIDYERKLQVCRSLFAIRQFSESQAGRKRKGFPGTQKNLQEKNLFPLPFPAPIVRGWLCESRVAIKRGEGKERKKEREKEGEKELLLTLDNRLISLGEKMGLVLLFSTFSKK